jgi:arsenite methyltransferase
MNDSSVRERYSQAAKEHEVGLCCPVDYDPKYLKVIPREILERDYGCGDPVSHVAPGEVVLDLGCGGGKVCFVAAQIVGPDGHVIGVDINDEMLALARKARPLVSRDLGFDNIEFRKGRIEDLSLDCDLVDARLQKHRLGSAADLEAFDRWLAIARHTTPLIADCSVDVVISNCVLNLVAPEKKTALLREIHRVLKPGGRAVISDIVSDEDVPEEMQNDSNLWSGCYSGALREDRFLAAFADAGLYGVHLVSKAAKPWETVNGIEFRSTTIAAYKGKEGPCWEHLQAAVYRGPFKRVEDDDNHVFERGHRMAVCDKTFRILGRSPYREHFDLIEPEVSVPPDSAKPFNCNVRVMRRDPKDTKNGTARQTESTGSSACRPDSGCC